MPNTFESDTLLTPPSITTDAPPAPDGTHAPETAPGLPESPEAYTLGLEDFIASDQSLTGLQIDQNLEADFRKTAHALGMSQEAAGELAKMYARHQARQATEHSARQAKAMQEAEASWLAELKADKNFPAELGRARAAIKAYGSPELTNILEDTRLGSHPAFVHFMARVGQALAEPSFTPGSPHNPDKSPAEVLYPNQGK